MVGVRNNLASARTRAPTIPSGAGAGARNNCIRWHGDGIDMSACLEGLHNIAFCQGEQAVRGLKVGESGGLELGTVSVLGDVRRSPMGK